MLAGLLTYGAGTLLALLATQFETLLLARVIAAFGAAVGSGGDPDHAARQLSGQRSGAGLFGDGHRALP